MIPYWLKDRLGTSDVERARNTYQGWIDDLAPTITSLQTELDGYKVSLNNFGMGYQASGSDPSTGAVVTTFETALFRWLHNTGGYGLMGGLQTVLDDLEARMVTLKARRDYLDDEWAEEDANQVYTDASSLPSWARYL